MEMDALTLVYTGLILLALIILFSSIKIVPQRKAYIVERLGKYRTTFTAGFNLVFPFIDRVQYRHTLKEQAIDVASQICITRDNISVEVDGILYLQVIDPMKASYGIDHYQFASIPIAQTIATSVSIPCLSRRSAISTPKADANPNPNAPRVGSNPIR